MWLLFSVRQLISLHTKAFCRRHFRVHICEKKIVFRLRFHSACASVSNWQWLSAGSYNGLSAYTRQAIIWNYNDTIHCVRGELNHFTVIQHSVSQIVQIKSQWNISPAVYTRIIWNVLKYIFILPFTQIIVLPVSRQQSCRTTCAPSIYW